jgi:hypothetical protein
MADVLVVLATARATLMQRFDGVLAAPRDIVEMSPLS